MFFQRNTLRYVFCYIYRGAITSNDISLYYNSILRILYIRNNILFMFVMFINVYHLR
jgi:hypothetical protein